MPDTALHQSHPDITKRLRRAEGHLRGVVAMIEESRPCLELAQLLRAVESAVREGQEALALEEDLPRMLARLLRPQRMHAPSAASSASPPPATGPSSPERGAAIPFKRSEPAA